MRAHLNSLESSRDALPSGKRICKGLVEERELGEAKAITTTALKLPSSPTRISNPRGRNRSRNEPAACTPSVMPRIGYASTPGKSTVGETPVVGLADSILMAVGAEGGFKFP